MFGLAPCPKGVVYSESKQTITITKQKKKKKETHAESVREWLVSGTVPTSHCRYLKKKKKKRKKELGSPDPRLFFSPCLGCLRTHNCKHAVSTVCNLTGGQQKRERETVCMWWPRLVHHVRYVCIKMRGGRRRRKQQNKKRGGEKGKGIAHTTQHARTQTTKQFDKQRCAG